MPHYKSHQPLASSRCPNPFPEKRPVDPKGKKDPTKAGQVRTASFDGLSTLCLHDVLLDTFLDANLHPEFSGWNWPSLDLFLKRQREAIYGHRTDRIIPYGEAQDTHGLQLVVAVVEDVDDSALREARTRKLCRNTIFQGWKGLAFALRPLRSLQPLPSILVPDFRMKIARRKISTYGGNWIHGPYLAILLVEKTTGLAVRARFWPIWVDRELNRFAITRSKPESILAQAISNAGGVSFNPTSLKQLETLQRAFGHFWGGNIAAYPFLPDSILMPTLGRQPSIGEFFGLPELRHYAVGMISKLLVGSKGARDGDYFFTSIAGKRGAPLTIEEQIMNWITNLYTHSDYGLYKTNSRTAWGKAS